LTYIYSSRIEAHRARAVAQIIPQQSEQRMTRKCTDPITKGQWPFVQCYADTKGIKFAHAWRLPAKKHRGES